MCDNCAFSSEIKEVDASGHSKLLISLVREMQEKDQRVTMLQLVDRVKNKQKQLDFELKREEMEQLVVQLILDRVLKEEFQHTAYATNSYVTVGPRANQVMLGKKIIKMDVTSTSKDVDGYRKSSKHGVTLGLEFKLDKLRKELASHDKGIFPHSLEKIIGKLKTEKYGGRILEEVKKYGNAEHPNNEVLNEEESSEIRPPRKKLKKANKQVIMVDSSNDESD
ncbi:hypothetical protein Golob_014121 [Gossypium lobatum]|nr:hypothetical protein [Gossypium lobatum]